MTEIVPQLAELGFDVLYFPPIHPIGRTNRKGRNNTERAEPGDVGSPWAIGGAEGGHDAIHPDLGTEAELEALVAALREHEMELALDLALQCSPDHPWLRDHPEWFQHRPDGSLKYAENPPKRYQDIHNLDWDTEDRVGLWQAVLDVVLHWCGAGRDGVPRRQPAHEARALLGVADRRGARVAPGDRLPLGGLHAAVDDDAPREGRVLAVLHLLHVEEHEVGARGVRRAAPLVVDLPPPEPVAEHAGHPPRAPADRRPAGVREQARPRDDPLADLRHLLRLRELRERPAALRERGVPALGEVRAARAGARRAAPAARAAAERAAARASRPDPRGARAAHVARDRERAPARLRADARRRRRPLRRQPRPVRGARRGLRRSLPRSACRSTSASSTGSPGRATSGAGATTSASGPASRTSSRWRTHERPPSSAAPTVPGTQTRPKRTRPGRPRCDTRQGVPNGQVFVPGT